MLCVWALACVSVAGQIGVGGNVVYGDFKIDASKTQEKVPSLFYVVLTTHRAGTSERRPVSPGGRFRFVNVPNGEYDLIVELEGREVTRLRIIVQPPMPTDFRYDIELEWRETISNNKPATVSALYPRSAAQQRLFDQASAEKDADKAIGVFLQLLKNDPKDFVAWTDLGALYFKQNNLDEALNACQKALAEKPDFLLALLNLGKLQIARKEYDKAVPTLEKALAAKPTSPEANYLLGEAWLNLKKGSKAVGYLYEALRLAPSEMADAHLRLALLYHAAGYKDRAAAEYEQFLAKRPDYKGKEKLLQYIKDNKKP
jgi:Tfp pilus assembly protein PilF